MPRSLESKLTRIMKKQTFNLVKIKNYLNDLFETNIHAKRIKSIANAVQGVIAWSSPICAVNSAQFAPLNSPLNSRLA